MYVLFVSILKPQSSHISTHVRAIVLAVATAELLYENMKGQSSATTDKNTVENHDLISSNRRSLVIILEYLTIKIPTYLTNEDYVHALQIHYSED